MKYVNSPNHIYNPIKKISNDASAYHGMDEDLPRITREHSRSDDKGHCDQHNSYKVPPRLIHHMRPYIHTGGLRGLPIATTAVLCPKTDFASTISLRQTPAHVAVADTPLDDETSASS